MKLYVFFKDGIPKNILNEPMLDQLVEKGLTSKFDWECYTPEKKYFLPWKPEKTEPQTLEEVIYSYCQHVVKLVGGKDKAAKILDIDRKTLYRYLKAIENEKWLNDENT
ncbi:hypothetical protein [Immundisolibacter sp.]